MNLENYIFMGVFSAEDLESERFSGKNVIYKPATINGAYSDRIYEIYLMKDKT